MNALPCALVLTTAPSPEVADALTRQLVSDRLAACAHVLPFGRSVYWWKDAIESADECQILFKTTPTRVAALSEALSAAHPYEVPEILVLTDVAASEAYAHWIHANVS